MVDLLKQKSKIGMAQRGRKTYEIADVFKKQRTTQG